MQSQAKPYELAIIFDTIPLICGKDSAIPPLRGLDTLQGCSARRLACLLVLDAAALEQLEVA